MIADAAAALRSFVPAMGWTLVHFVWQGALLAALVATVLTLMRRRSSAARYRAACGGLALAVALPLATFALCWPSVGDVGRSSSAADPGHPSISGSSAPVEITVDVTLPGQSPDPFQRRTPAPPIATSGPPTHASPRPDLTTLQRAIQPALGWIVLAWILGVTVGILRLCVSWLGLRRLRHSGVRSAAATWSTRLIELARRLGIRRSILLLESVLTHTPTVIGWIRPAILMPAALFSGLSQRQVEASSKRLSSITRRRGGCRTGSARSASIAAMTWR
jgi:hypothetical protein